MSAVSSVPASMPRAMTAIVVALRRVGLPLGCGSSPHLFTCVALDDLVEFTSIQPDTPTLRAIIDLDALSFAHDQIDPAGWAKKSLAFVSGGSVFNISHLRLLIFTAKPDA